MPEKNYPFDKVKNFILEYQLSTDFDSVMKVNETTGVMEYYAALMTIGGTPCGANGEVRRQTIEVYLGAPKLQPWTPQEMADAIKGYNNMNTVAFNNIKTLYLQLINQTIT